MKLRKNDKVLVIAGKDKGKTGTITRVLPKDNTVVIDGINVVKRHTKPSNKHPQGGILEINKPVTAAKVMLIDPATKLPVRVGARINKDGSKERLLKPSRYTKAKMKDTAKDSAKSTAKEKKS